MKNHTASRLFGALCRFAVMLALAAGIIAVPAFAAAGGAYLATASPYYKNPATGVIEDSGGEKATVLGQSMTESATYKKALVEVDSSGNTYVTVRLQLMDSVRNPQFRVSPGGKTGFTPVSVSLMQEDYNKNTADYRMKVPNEKAIIRCNMEVVPMGRSVIFYITVNHLSSGSGDFVVSVKQPSPQKTNPFSQPNSSARPGPGKTPSSSAKGASAISSLPASSAPSGAQESSTASSAISSAERSALEADASSSLSAGLAEFDASGKVVNAATASGLAEPGRGSAAEWVAGIAAVVLLAALCVWYFGFFKKRSR